MIFLIADLHLRVEKPDVCENFLRFLRGKALAADALYILGDLFEIWLGDDDLNSLHCEIATAIKALVNLGIPCFFIHGNRDFLIGKRFAYKSGMILLPEEKVLNLYGHNILIMHGDTLCTSDVKYQVFRTILHMSWIKILFLALPSSIRRFIASKIRVSSKEASNSKSIDIMDVNQQKVIEVMKKYNVQLLVHGHTHRPNIHKFIVNDKPAFRVVLSNWCYIGSIVEITPQDVKFIYFLF